MLADPANYPVFFHCHHGINRTSMVQIAYRTKYCGWTLEQAADEIERTVGLVKVNHGPDYRHMVSFYENRVLPHTRGHGPEGRGRQGREVDLASASSQNSHAGRRLGDRDQLTKRARPSCFWIRSGTTFREPRAPPTST